MGKFPEILLFSIITIVSVTIQADTQCDALFPELETVTIANCSKEKIDITGYTHGKRIKMQGSISYGEKAYTNFDLKLKNDFITPANTGRYITHIDSKFKIAGSKPLQVIHSNSIFGDGQKSKDNTYYACTYPNFQKCLMLEFNGSMSKKNASLIISRIFEKEW
ncbi:hypothetical protein [Chromobacterium phragmitis]|uniref:hypothetical protein n=1 Tax=Chromobacterium phragmitis TaxID=2202141 RepID=UPI0011AE287B|nr:hypothetical protein [Chromobacterium phragmitis]